MKKGIRIGLVVVLILGLAVSLYGCTVGQLLPYKSIAYADSPPSSGTSSDIMIVFYFKNSGIYLFWCDMTAQIVDNGDTWDVYSPQVNASGVSKSAITYGYYKYKAIEEPIYDEEGNELPIYIDDLDLEEVTANDLPKSEHIGKLVAVDTALAKPATVRRKWMGQTYDVQCLVTESVKAMYQAGVLQLGDYVLVSFIEEIPDTTEISVAIVTDKVYESW